MKSILDILVIVSLVLRVNCLNNLGASIQPLADEWWGPRELQQYQDTSIRPFRVEFPDEVINDLRYRLLNHRKVAPPLENVGFTYGFNVLVLDYWTQYWANGYNFKARENYLNQFPQFKTNIQGLDIHFLWVRPQVPQGIEVVPLLYLHGWPGTVRELYESIPYLTAVNTSRPFAIEVIAPSLPGFGFSSTAVRPGLGATQMAVIFKNLMHRLGFFRYYIQGGDWGATIGSNMATLYPQEVLGFHTNLAVAATPKALAIWFAGAVNPSLVVPPELEDRLYPIQSIIVGLIRETGFFHIQASKPESIGVAMSDSPAGLLAYILQLISSGTSKSSINSVDGDLEKYFSRDALLDILTIFWVTNSFTTSIRIYGETFNVMTLNSTIASTPTPVPTWSIHAKDELVYMTPKMLRTKYTNLLHSTVLNDGGHFLALEKPEILSSDIILAISCFRRWHEMNRGRGF